MTTRSRITLGALALAGLASASAVVAGPVAAGTSAGTSAGSSPATIKRQLTPSSAALAACMPGADLDVSVALTTDQVGVDAFTVHARHLPPSRLYTVFLLETAGAPFGAAEYIGDFTTDATGRADNTYRLIVQEAFASTLVAGVRTRVDLNQVGVWFADPADDEFCLPGSPPTPFDGDAQAGVQAFNSANAAPLPAP